VAHALFRSPVLKVHALLRGFYRIEPVIVMSAFPMGLRSAANGVPVGSQAIN
jgi:hypothetical protein